MSNDDVLAKTVRAINAGDFALFNAVFDSKSDNKSEVISHPLANAVDKTGTPLIHLVTSKIVAVQAEEEKIREPYYHMLEKLIDVGADLNRLKQNRSVLSLLAEVIAKHGYLLRAREVELFFRLYVKGANPNLGKPSVRFSIQYEYGCDEKEANKDDLDRLYVALRALRHIPVTFRAPYLSSFFITQHIPREHWNRFKLPTGFSLIKEKNAVPFDVMIEASSVELECSLRAKQLFAAVDKRDHHLFKKALACEHDETRWRLADSVNDHKQGLVDYVCDRIVQSQIEAKEHRAPYFNMMNALMDAEADVELKHLSEEQAPLYRMVKMVIDHKQELPDEEKLCFRLFANGARFEKKTQTMLCSRGIKLYEFYVAQNYCLEIRREGRKVFVRAFEDKKYKLISSPFWNEENNLKKLLQALKEYKGYKVFTLDVGHNYINPNVVARILKAMSANANCDEVSVFYSPRDSKIQQDGFTTMMEGFNQWKNLKTLSVQAMDVNAIFFCKTLGDALKGHQALIYLTIRFQYVQSEPVSELTLIEYERAGRALAQLPALRNLTLISDCPREMLSELLTHASALTSLTVDKSCQQQTQLQTWAFFQNYQLMSLNNSGGNYFPSPENKNDKESHDQLKKLFFPKNDAESILSFMPKEMRQELFLFFAPHTSLLFKMAMVLQELIPHDLQEKIRIFPLVRAKDNGTSHAFRIEAPEMKDAGKILANVLSTRNALVRLDAADPTIITNVRAIRNYLIEDATSLEDQKKFSKETLRVDIQKAFTLFSHRDANANAHATVAATSTATATLTK